MTDEEIYDAYVRAQRKKEAQWYRDNYSKNHFRYSISITISAIGFVLTLLSNIDALSWLSFIGFPLIMFPLVFACVFLMNAQMANNKYSEWIPSFKRKELPDGR